MATIEERFCRDDGDCSDKQYCYHVSERCVDYTQCNRYNRLENHEKKSRDPSQCGPCLTGYIAEKLGTGEMALFCRKTNAQQDIPEVVKLDNTMIIYSVIGTFLFSIIAVFGILLFKRRRSKRQRNMVKPRDELGVMEPTAPPLENSPFIRCKKELSPVPFNNNKILKDKNDLVRAVGFVPPSWVHTNSNYEYDMSNDNVDAIGQQHPVSEPTDNRSNNLMPEQLAYEVTNGNLAGYEIEQADNSLNTILVQANNPSSSNDSTQENNNNNNNNGSTSESSNTQNNRENIRISNILISQKISMNVNLLNDDC